LTSQDVKEIDYANHIPSWNIAWRSWDADKYSVYAGVKVANGGLNLYSAESSIDNGINKVNHGFFSD
jgi:hypothetical protein